MKFKIPSKKLFVALLVAIAVLLLMNVVSIFLAINYEDKNPFTAFIIRLFDFNQVASIPSFFSSILLLSTSFLFFFITFSKKSRNKHYGGWLGLTLLFIFLALIKGTSFHEFSLTFFSEKLDLSGFPYFTWLLAYALVISILGFIYIPFVKNLNQKLLYLMLISAAIYISGAIGFEIIGNNTFETNGLSFSYRMFYTAEETLEMIGLAILIYTLNWYISIKDRKVSFELT